ncbi:MAG: DUF1980 domain-containing protein, partial [Clostridiales Family XIII bacterium]|nr:DUF1980 domain-containing protein [Clostridiales Family XIII bacterium]
MMIVCLAVLSSAALLLSSCDDSASGKVDGAQGKDTQRNGAGTVSVDTAEGGDVAEGTASDGENPEGGGAEAAHSRPDRSDEGPLVVGDKMFVGQMNDIYLNPNDYIGRTIRYEGFFTYFDNEETG